jgi:hypothetical protein
MYAMLTSDCHNCKEDEALRGSDSARALEWIGRRIARASEEELSRVIEGLNEIVGS